MRQQFSAPKAACTCVVPTQYGAVQGEERDGVAIFRGIPYGGDCDGENRFLPPQPPKAWVGVKDCTQNGFCAIQNGGSICKAEGGLGAYFSGGKPERFGVQEETYSENCLVLNVMTPAPDDAKRPVAVYLHGGGFASGSGALMLGADDWVKEEDLVVVGVNHRLNVFGYLYLRQLDEAYADSGFAGILDLVLALQWVQNNIAAFGGDPHRVTIMGESGGGVKVTALLALPQARGLFSRAVVESGSVPPGQFTEAQSAALTRQLLAQLGLTAQTWRQLLTLPASALLQALDSLGESSMLLSPVLPGSLAEDSYELPEFSKNIPLLVGSSEDEMAVFLPVEQLKITWENLPAQLQKAFRERPEDPRCLSLEAAQRVVEAFKAPAPRQTDPLHLYCTILSLSSSLGGGAWYQAVAKASQGGAPVYQYLVRYDVPHPALPQLRVAWHTAELPLQMRIVLHRESEAFSRRMAHSWAAFIRTGNPSTPQLPWPPFTPESPQLMLWEDPQCTVQADPQQALRCVLEQNGASVRR